VLNGQAVGSSSLGNPEIDWDNVKKIKTLEKIMLWEAQQTCLVDFPMH
jgi:hypothetical protein